MANLTQLEIRKQQYSFEHYLEFVEELVSNHLHSGETDDALLKKFTATNQERLQRTYSKFTLTQTEAQQVSKLAPQTWILIGESWCGDVNSSLPVIAKLAQASAGAITLRIILRDQNPDVMNLYLSPTGGRSIPKLIIFNIDGQEVGNWGSRPQGLNKLAAAWKEEKLPFMEIVKHVYAWYDEPENQHEIAKEVLEIATR